MNIDQVDRFRQLLIEAVDEYLGTSQGTIVSGAFSTEEGQCPLSCLFGKVSDMTAWAKECQELIGTALPTEELWAFAIAFDGSVYSNYKPLYPSAWLLGKELRAKYIQE